MAKKNIHINTIINKAMHRPIVQSTGEVLYPVIDSYSGKLEGNAGNKSPEYIEKSKVICNSPTNIRRIFVTYEGVTVDYFTTPMHPKNNGKMRTQIKFSSFLSSDYGVSDFREVGKKIWTYQQDLHNYNMEKQINKNAQAPDEFNVTGNVFGIMSNLYACNNIEEFYVDWTIMLCDAIRPITCRDAILGDSMLLNYIEGNVQSGAVQDNGRMLEGLFRRFNELDRANVEIKSRFPRLKVIAFVPRLKQLLDLMDQSTPGSIMPSKDDSEQTMLDKSASLFDKQNNVFVQAGCLYKTFGLPNRINKEFRIKDSQYKFDRECLKTFAAMYNERVTNIERTAKYGGTGTHETNATANLSEVEQYIKNLLDSNYESAKTIITLASVGHSTQNIKDLLAELSKPTREKVASIIGFDLSKLNQ